MYTSYRTSQDRRAPSVDREVVKAKSAKNPNQYLIMGVTTFVALILLTLNAYARSAPDSFADLAEKLSPAVVNISTTQTVKNDRQGAFPQLPPGHPFEDFFKDFGRKVKMASESAKRLLWAPVLFSMPMKVM